MWYLLFKRVLNNSAPSRVLRPSLENCLEMAKTSKEPYIFINIHCGLVCIAVVGANTVRKESEQGYKLNGKI